MKDILFRAKSNQSWYYGTLYYNGNENYYHGRSKHWYIVDKTDGIEVRINPNTICEFTGLTDKNGNKIFENDIVRIGRYFTNNFLTEDNYLCIYNEKVASFMFYYIIPKDTEKINTRAKLNDGVSIIDLGIGFTLEVIGNIFDTKELLEEDD